jgi:hypothetical protein
VACIGTALALYKLDVGLRVSYRDRAKCQENVWTQRNRENCTVRNFICEISSSHGGEYDVQSCLLGYTVV